MLSQAVKYIMTDPFIMKKPKLTTVPVPDSGNPKNERMHC